MLKTTLQIKVIPSAAQTTLVGWEEEVLKIRLHAPPERGKANKELIAFLSKVLKIPKQSIEIIRGETARLKIVSIKDISRDQIKGAVGAALDLS